jgi:acyl-CoA reductase-like NAD-dependent aldehyde dehydrogenase
MKDEVFGPLLPILPIQDLDEAISHIRSVPKPLALYLFTKDAKSIDRVLEQTQSGGACVNDTLLHITLSTLPFGGVGQSGIGRLHGKYSFDSFSHHRSVMIRSYWGEWFSQLLRYPPMTAFKWSVLNRVLFSRPRLTGSKEEAKK